MREIFRWLLLLLSGMVCDVLNLGLLTGVSVTDLCVCVRFNMLAFSGEVRMWQPALVQSTEELCVEAVQWLNQLSTHGASSTLQALQVLTTILTIITFLYTIITQLYGKSMFSPVLCTQFFLCL